VDGVVGNLIAAGVVGTILTVMLALVRVAVAAERRRADDWRETAQTGQEANAVMNGNVVKLIASVEQLAASQRETNATVQSMVGLLTSLVGDRRVGP
jgi:hypothetical protein